MDTPGLQPRMLSLWLWEPRLSLPPSCSSCPLSKPAPTTPEAQLVISKEKRNWYPTTVPVFLPAFLFNKKECQKQTLYPQGTSRFLSSTSCNQETPFLCFCFHHMFSAATVHMFITLFFWLFANKPSFPICFSLLIQSSWLRILFS